MRLERQSRKADYCLRIGEVFRLCATATSLRVARILVTIVGVGCACALVTFGVRRRSVVTSSQYSRPERALRSADISAVLPPGSGTAADQRLQRMLGGDGERLDLAAVNWLLAADLPEFAGWTREAYFHQLNEMTRQVREEMARMQAVAVSRGERLEEIRFA